ncbi:class I SAM-dependent methyltransferase [Ktedonospora formicarum]|uniref:Putative methyltransferase YdaC n=1 Tax=Ktedonospora formicarum TaxID=2778364 RepID=A0A8J3MTJ1_9CHLR|nr:class I SAM-dependent methyltransferase [Ktedonospora formicarum]GHO45643.1 putative methyltransferase YdaC [Ktedonospora formicarum]
MINDNLFAHPRGILGRLGGQIMARSNRPLYEWTFSLLPIRSGESVLEVGFGAGEAIHMLTHRTQADQVVGIDASTQMLRLAKRRNATALLSGRAQLHQGYAEKLPFPENTFHVAFAINSVQIWADRKAAILELWRVLRPEGILALTFQPRHIKSELDFKAISDQLVFDLTQTGFSDVNLQIKPHKAANILCALGHK